MEDIFTKIAVIKNLVHTDVANMNYLVVSIRPMWEISFCFEQTNYSGTAV